MIALPGPVPEWKNIPDAADANEGENAVGRIISADSAAPGVFAVDASSFGPAADPVAGTCAGTAVADVCGGAGAGGACVGAGRGSATSAWGDAAGSALSALC